MKPLVIDASVALKWFIPEEDSVAARTLLVGNHELLAPDLIYVEFSGVLRKLVRTQEMTAEEAILILDTFCRLPIRTHPHLPLCRDALQVALAYGQSPYDCHYLALARREKCVMVTADRRFYHALQHTVYKDHVMLVAGQGLQMQPGDNSQSNPENP